jgi:hypothetical protein
MAQLLQGVAGAKHLIFGAQENAPRCLTPRQLDGVSYSLTAIRSSLEQLCNTLRAIQEEQR